MTLLTRQSRHDYGLGLRATVLEIFQIFPSSFGCVGDPPSPRPLSSEYGSFKTVKVKICLGPSVKSPQNRTANNPTHDTFHPAFSASATILETLHHAPGYPHLHHPSPNAQTRATPHPCTLKHKSRVRLQVDQRIAVIKGERRTTGEVAELRSHFDGAKNDLSTGWEPFYDVALGHADATGGGFRLDSRGSLSRSQLACKMDAACAGSNCVAVQCQVEEDAVLVVRVIGVLDPAASSRRAVRPGERLTWNFTEALGADDIHIRCAHCAYGRKEGSSAGRTKGSSRPVRLKKSAVPGQPRCCGACFYWNTVGGEGGAAPGVGGGGGGTGLAATTGGQRPGWGVGGAPRRQRRQRGKPRAPTAPTRPSAVENFPSRSLRSTERRGLVPRDRGAAGCFCV